MTTLLNIIEQHLQDADDVHFYFLHKGDQECKSYPEIISEAKRLANYLYQRFEFQSRILLVYSPGLDFISSFLGCLYAGMIAVPAYPLSNSRQAYRLKAMIDSCQPKLILGNAEVIQNLASISDLDFIEKIATESLVAGNLLNDVILQPLVEESTIAFLQYTSGSTGKPKGVMVSHRNLMSNFSSLKTGWGLGEKKTSVLWLPFQHDLGLIGGVLSSLYNKNDLVLMAPMTVIQSPYSWLKALSDFKAYFTAGPNFAYQLCVNRISDAELATLDLLSVDYALAAAEPNRYTTMKQFCDKFSACGFKREAYSVGYGLAENTLHVTTNIPGRSSQYLSLSKECLAKNIVSLSKKQNDTQYIASGGALHPAHEVVIVNPETLLRSDEGCVGEIWVHGNSVACGYWGNPEATTETFKARLVGEQKEYLRTGDLGFIYDNELYITGRRKDLIIIDGRNIYPQDIEAAAEFCHEFIKPGCSVAFSVMLDDKEALVVCVELRTQALKHDVSNLDMMIRDAIAKQYEVAVHEVVLLKPNGSFKTTSGKIQRQATKKAYLENTLEKQFADENEWITLLAKTPKEKRESMLTHCIQQLLGEVMHIDDHTINLDQSFFELGMDSLMSVEFKNKLQHKIGSNYKIRDSLFFDYSSVNGVVKYLRKEGLKL